MQDRYYQIYWCSEDGQRAYHLDPETNAPYRYYTYSDMFEAGEGIRSFSGEHKLMFDIIESA